MRDDGGLLLVREDLERTARDLGLGAPGSWEEVIGSRRGGRGRGATGRVELPSGGRAVVKCMRRGGLAGPFWRDRFAGVGRLLENLTVPEAAKARGIPTAAALALLLVEGPPRLWMAWLAVEEIAGAEDLETRFRDKAPRLGDELAAALALVRRAHDSGLEHRDLNLGNLLIRPTATGAPEAFLVDLDRARLHAAPLGFAARRAAIRRIERSYLKRFGDPGPLGEDPGSILRALYASGDDGLASRLRAARPLDRLLVGLHRAGGR